MRICINDEKLKFNIQSSFYYPWIASKSLKPNISMPRINKNTLNSIKRQKTEENGKKKKLGSRENRT